MRFTILLAAAVSTVLLSRARAAPAVSPGRAHGLSMKTSYSAENDEEVLKYFHEAGGSVELSHYDRRYFHGMVNDEERTDTQIHMIRAYLEFFRGNGLDTWIAHGSLLGWFWNGKRLPWDLDLDTQVSHSTLQRLGSQFNQTRHTYVSPDMKWKREYLLDVNQYINERTRGNGMNVIDARWIDVRNGLFIDITGLSEVEPSMRPGLWSCKNNHRYLTTDLYPMRETLFEGVLAKVPYAYDQILTDEYMNSALVNEAYNGHLWDRDQKLWVKSPATLAAEEELRKYHGEWNGKPRDEDNEALRSSMLN